MDFNINNMKKIITLIIIICTTTLIQAQGDLVFNKALILEIGFTPITVPEGKVWKVQGTNGGALVLLTDNSFFTLYQGLWMPEGFSFRESSSGSTATSVNVLEFDVVPLSSSSNSGATAGFSAEGLEFNKVINYQVNESATTTYGGPIGSIEIPEGKVWKITRVTITTSSNTTNPYRTQDVSSVGLYLGDILIFYRPSTSGYSNSSYDSYPVWINSGTKQLAIGRMASSGAEYRITISAIEYNIPE